MTKVSAPFDTPFQLYYFRAFP